MWRTRLNGRDPFDAILNEGEGGCEGEGEGGCEGEGVSEG
jgi:hypothetical protein